MEKKRIKKTPVSKSVRVSKKTPVLQKPKVSNISKVSKTIKIAEDFSKNKNQEISFNILGFMNDFAQALVIASVLILLTISFIIVGGQKASKEIAIENNQNSFNILGDVKVVKKEKGFFGTLLMSATGKQESSNVAGMGSSETLAVRSADGKMMAGVSTDMGIMPPMEITKYSYKYVGEDFELFPAEVDVYKKINPDLSEEVARNFTNQKISFFDLKKFKNINVNNLTINEDRDYGYSLYLGLKDGNFSVYKNWEKWPSVDKLCRGLDNSCYQNYQLSVNDVLSDEETIKIANEFLSEYDISLNNYGPGEVQKNWMREYTMSSDKASFYIPDSVSVIFPLKIEGKNIYEEYGSKFGLTVEVDMREKKVASVYNLFYQYYESSSYATESDKESIMKMVNQGGLYPDYNYEYPEDVTVKDVEIKIGTPTLEMVKLWNYNNEEMNGYELYVPAYVFPVISEDESVYFYKKNIIIPAVKDFFNNNNNPVIMYDNVKGSEPAVSAPSIGVETIEVAR